LGEYRKDLLGPGIDAMVSGISIEPLTGDLILDCLPNERQGLLSLPGG
jgi:hypothetical protein